MMLELIHNPLNIGPLKDLLVKASLFLICVGLVTLLGVLKKRLRLGWLTSGMAVLILFYMMSANDYLIFMWVLTGLGSIIFFIRRFVRLLLGLN